MIDEEDIFGTDLDDSFELDDNGQFKIVSGVDNAIQAIRNRLLTKFDEIAELGYFEYGNKAHDYLSETNIDLAKAHIELYNEICLDLDHRVFNIIDMSTEYKYGVITADIHVQLVDSTIVSLGDINYDILKAEAY
jgi:hypothetical protein